MTRRGLLLVLEGPDGVGKTTLARALTERLQRDGHVVDYRAFPGHDPGTLGHLVYRLHHDPASLGVAALTEAARQVMHVAAHADAVETAILPALSAGRILVLDRYWWSTWVYGRVGGMPLDVLEALIALEKRVWRGVVPSLLFLVDRDRPWGVEEAAPEWEILRRSYRDFADAERGRYPIAPIPNDRPIDAAMEALMAQVPGTANLHPDVRGPRPDAQRRHLSIGEPQLGLGLEPPHSTLTPPSHAELAGGLAPARPTKVFDTYWRFAAERQAVFFRRFYGEHPPWTQDPIIRHHKFTNAYRASDRVSQYLIRHVIYEGDQSPEEVAFRILIFKLFNRIETWELLRRSLGNISYADFSVPRYDRVLADAQDRGERIYSAAYIMPPARSAGTPRKHTGHLLLLKRMFHDELPLHLTDARSLRHAFELLRAYPMFGDFLAYQFVIDLNYSTVLNFSEMEFILPGPGARSGIRKCFDDLGGLSDADLIRLVTEQQAEEFARRGLRFETLWGRPLQLVDCQNLFCEVDKYARLAHPDVRDPAGRERIKQIYRRHPLPVSYWYPPKWDLNERVAADSSRHAHHHQDNR